MLCSRSKSIHNNWYFTLQPGYFFKRPREIINCVGGQYFAVISMQFLSIVALYNMFYRTMQTTLINIYYIHSICCKINRVGGLSSCSCVSLLASYNKPMNITMQCLTHATACFRLVFQFLFHGKHRLVCYIT